MESPARDLTNSTHSFVVACSSTTRRLGTCDAQDPKPPLLVLGSWVGARHPFHLPLFLTAPRLVLPQDPSTTGADGVTLRASSDCSGEEFERESGRLPQPLEGADIGLKSSTKRHRFVAFDVLTTPLGTSMEWQVWHPAARASADAVTGVCGRPAALWLQGGAG